MIASEVLSVLTGGTGTRETDFSNVVKAAPEQLPAKAGLVQREGAGWPPGALRFLAE
jgi:hypothetical protein